jgi:threonylcarbamoyladenosine tRNA methylthiotransferase MtaB
MEDVITFGCRLNIYESEVIKGIIRKAGLQDMVVFNTCTVTEEAEHKCLQAIRKLKREHPHVKVVVTGCATQMNSEKYMNMPEVDQVVSNKDKLNPNSYIQAAPTDLPFEPSSGAVTFENRTRALIQIQNGCNKRCSYCIIPYARGNNVSVPIHTIIEQVRMLTMEGYKEVVLTGINITLYGQDFSIKASITDMLKALLNALPDLARLRLTSLDVADIDEPMLNLMLNEKRLMPHFHLSLQSCNNEVLRKMRRRHTCEQVRELCSTIRKIRPEVAFGADIITGFPTETEAMFKSTCEFLDEVKIPYLHVFPYSERQGTPAARLPQIDTQVRRDRARIVREIGQRVLNEFSAKYVGQTGTILTEKNNVGRMENFLKVHLHSEQQIEAGQLIPVRVTGYDDQKLIAVML